MSAPAAAPAVEPVVLEGKLVIVGDSNVGKTSLIAAFLRSDITLPPRPSIGVSFAKRTISVGAVTLNLQMWDTAGQERFRSLNTMYYRGAGAAVLVYDVTSAQSFESLEYWLREVRQHGCPNMIVCLCGNKCDAPKAARQVSSDAAREFAERHGTLLIETSARTGVNVEEMFRMIAREAPRLAVPAESNIRDGAFRVVESSRASLSLGESSASDDTAQLKSCC